MWGTLHRPPANDGVACPQSRKEITTRHVFSLLFYYRSRLSLLYHPFCDVVGLGTAIIIRVLSIGSRGPPDDGAALLPRYPRIVPDLRKGLPEY